MHVLICILPEDKSSAAAHIVVLTFNLMVPLSVKVAEEERTLCDMLLEIVLPTHFSKLLSRYESYKHIVEFALRRSFAYFSRRSSCNPSPCHSEQNRVSSTID